jgi:hypothetical protein
MQPIVEILGIIYDAAPPLDEGWPAAEDTIFDEGTVTKPAVFSSLTGVDFWAPSLSLCCSGGAPL